MAHEGMIWSLAWHPLGHILCSGSNDHTRLDTRPYLDRGNFVLSGGDSRHSRLHRCFCFSKFWTRNRPGDKMRDRYNLNLLPGMSEDGLEYGELQPTRGHEVALRILMQGCVCSRRRGPEQRGLHPWDGHPRPAEGRHGAGAEQ